MFNVAGGQGKGVSDIVIKNSKIAGRFCKVQNRAMTHSGKAAALLKAKSSDDIKGKRQSEKPDNQRAMTRRGSVFLAMSVKFIINNNVLDNIRLLH